MKRRIVVITGIGAALLAALLPYGSVGIARAGSLPALALTKSDIPAGYKQITAKTDTIQSAASSAKVSVATLRSQGWLGSYESTFQKSNGTTATDIDSGVDHFKSASGVRWDLSNGLALIKKQYPNGKTFAVSGLGDQALGIKIAGKSGKVAYTIVEIAFRKGAYLGSAGISVAGPMAAPTTAAVMHYANIVEARLKNA